MTTADKVCKISFPGFIDDAKKTRVPATEVTLRRPPKSGNLGIVAGQGLVYTPNPGFKGKDTFCTKNTSPKVKGKARALAALLRRAVTREVDQKELVGLLEELDGVAAKAERP